MQKRFGRIIRYCMDKSSENLAPPKWLVVKLGDDSNWWVERVSIDTPSTELGSVLDPDQWISLSVKVKDHFTYGLSKTLFESAFCGFSLESELSEAKMKLALSQEILSCSSTQLYALPSIEGDSVGRYYEFLESLGAAHIRLLNETSRYACDYTENEMYEELDALDSERYFARETIHCFDEMMEILNWDPAQWDSSGREEKV